MVLWPNPTSKLLSRFAIRRHSSATLDLGTGSGILSLGAAKFSDTVVATDLNQRAVSFAAFNAKLNGVENIEVLAGDCFAPVLNRRFDLILSNPPFFITPQQGYMFCDNPMELDGLCRRLVREAPEYLNEGGYMQMLCEWAQVSGQPWEERIAEWLEGTGCDAWVMKGLTQDPAEYAQHRIQETSQNPADDASLYRGYMTYYRERGVEAIHDGLVVMRRRAGANWVQLEEVPKTPNGDLGELVLSTFTAHDLLSQLQDDESLLATQAQALRAYETGTDMRAVRWALDRGVGHTSAHSGFSVPFGVATAGSGVPGDLRRDTYRRTGHPGVCCHRQCPTRYRPAGMSRDDAQTHLPRIHGGCSRLSEKLRMMATVHKLTIYERLGRASGTPISDRGPDLWRN